MDSEKELRGIDEQSRAITENLPDIIIRVDIALRCIYVSLNVIRYTGIPSSEFIGKKLTEVNLRPDFAKNREKDFEEILQSKHDHQTVISVDTEMGQRILEWRMIPELEGGKEIYSILNIIRDITELQRTEEQFNKVFNLSSDMVCLANRDNILVKVNPAFENILGYSDQEILDQPFLSFVHPDDLENTVTIIKKETDIGKAINFENRFRCKDGSYKWFSWASQPFGDKKGMGFAIGRDITQQREAMHELIEAKEKAEESDRLKSAFLANMSHEIRTPMNAIMGFATLLQREQIEDEKRTHFASIIQKRSHDLLQIINDILDISKIESGQLKMACESFSINELLKDIHVELLGRKRSSNGKEVNFFIEKKVEKINEQTYNDILRIKQVIINLVDNALKFTEKGEVKFGCEYSKEFLTFYVSDTGIGIPIHKQNTIFERFRQAEESITRKYGGNGLGLAISKALVEMMGGRIWLSSVEGEGSSFYFTVKAVSRKKYIAEEIPEAIEFELDLHGKKVLIIEDDPLSIEYLRILLERSGAVVSVAKSGGEALILMDAFAYYDLILIDIQLPDVSGYEVTRRIRKINNKVPIIAQTAFAMQEDKDKCMEAGCSAFIPKPVRANELFDIVAQVINKTMLG